MLQITTFPSARPHIEHTRDDGYKYSVTRQMNEAGQVSGLSQRFNGGSSDRGMSAWLHNGTTTIDIGLTDAAHTRSNGSRISGDFLQLNQAGQVIGISYRFNDSLISGLSAWLYDGASTRNIGLTGVGNEYSEPRHLNEAGQVIGTSEGDSLGQRTWRFDGTATHRIDLTDFQHTRSGGYQFSDAYQLNGAGQARGYSERFSGANSRGRSAWLFDGTDTLHIGLTSVEHTRNDGYQFSDSHQLNDAGQVTGYSERFSGASARGQSAWLFDGAATVNIGLTGAGHTRNDDYKFTFAEQLNEAGQVVGYSNRYNGATQIGQTAWLYDSSLDQTYSLVVSTRSDGFAFSSAQYLGEDGLVLGRYTLFDSSGFNQGDRAFSFTVADGLHDLGSLVEGGLSANGWDRLATAFRANSAGLIIGHGKLSSQTLGQMAYLLTPELPSEVTQPITTGQDYSNVSPVGGSESDSVARLRGGTASNDGTVALSYQPGGVFAINGSQPVGDVLELTGTGTDVFVLELTYSEADMAAAGISSEEHLVLKWLDPNDNNWKNAVDGNTPPSSAAFLGFSYDDYLSGRNGVFTLGDYGNDPHSNTVWAVLNHNSLFAITSAVPEPASLALAGLGILGLASICQLHQRAKRNP